MSESLHIVRRYEPASLAFPDEFRQGIDGSSYGGQPRRHGLEDRDAERLDPPRVHVDVERPKKARDVGTLPEEDHGVAHPRLLYQGPELGLQRPPPRYEEARSRKPRTDLCESPHKGTLALDRMEAGDIAERDVPRSETKLSTCFRTPRGGDTPERPRVDPVRNDDR